MKPRRLFLGTYAKTGGEGLYPLDEAGGWRLGTPFAAARNCSFAAFDHVRGLAHCVDEQEHGLIRTCRLGEGGWQVVAEHPTGGSMPCYVARDPWGTRLAVANYGSGSLALFAIDPGTGCPCGEPRLWQSAGRGPEPDRQEGPHVHCALFDGAGRLYAVDLGTDRIIGFDLTSDPKLLSPFLAFAAPPGSGPRHLVLHPELPIAYLVSELASTITVLERQGGNFVARECLSTAPPGYRGENLGGHLSLNAAGTRLYVTNRGHDSVATFAVDARGDLSLLQHVPTLGASPRSFILLEPDGICAVANEEGQNIAIIALGADGLLGEAIADVSAAGAAFLFSAG